VNLGT